MCSWIILKAAKISSNRYENKSLSKRKCARGKVNRKNGLRSHSMNVNAEMKMILTGVQYI